VTVLQFESMAWPEVQALDKSRTLALLPVGAIEAHGPHLPLATDVLISVEMARRAASKLSAQGWVVLLLPPLSYTAAEFAKSFAGTICLTRETVQATVREVAESLRRAGVKYVCVANSHLDPENIEGLRQACAASDIVFPDKTRRRWVQTLTDEFKSGSCHAGQYETSLILAVRPDLVRPGHRLLPPMEVNLAEKISGGSKGFEEIGMKDAYCGAPSKATQEEGEKTFEILSDMIVTTLLEKVREAQG
jgi:creatinine amidohydrolase